MPDNQAIARTKPSPEAGQPAPPPAGFIAFFRAEYRKLMVTAMSVGATRAEADEAAAAAMEEVLRRWDQIDTPLAYGKRAALSNFFKEKERGLDRIRQRLQQGCEARRDGAAGAGLSVWEDKQWVIQILGSLPPAQREVLALVVDGLTPAEIALHLGKTAAAVRQNLCAARARLALDLLDHVARDSQNSGGPATEGGP